MNRSDEQSPGERRPSGTGPGERLQAARIQQGMSLEDVASRMHLSVSILEAIEENNFDEITAPIFVKGYLRAYARIVSLDEDEMIEQYVDYYSNEDPPISSISNTAPELTVADARIKWTTYAVVIVLAAMIGAWWWSQRDDTDAPISLDAQAPTGGQRLEAGGGDAVVSSEIEAVSESRTDTAAVVEVVEPAPAQTPAADASTSAAAVTEREPVAVTRTVTPEPVTPSPEPEPEAQAGAETDTASTTAAIAPAVTPEPASDRIVALPIAPSGTDRLDIVVNADSWADVKDANDYQLVYDLLRADEFIELVGEAPFSVFLGNGHGVEIRFNGEEINFASRIRDDNTARLKIGQ